MCVYKHTVLYILVLFSKKNLKGELTVKFKTFKQTPQSKEMQENRLFLIIYNTKTLFK